MISNCANLNRAEAVFDDDSYSLESGIENWINLLLLSYTTRRREEE